MSNSVFWEKKNIVNLSSAELAQRVIKNSMYPASDTEKSLYCKLFFIHIYLKYLGHLNSLLYIQPWTCQIWERRTNWSNLSEIWILSLTLASGNGWALGHWDFYCATSCLSCTTSCLSCTTSCLSCTTSCLSCATSFQTSASSCPSRYQHRILPFLGIPIWFLKAVEGWTLHSS